MKCRVVNINIRNISNRANVFISTEKKNTVSNWEFAEEDMSEQHKAIFRLKFFTDNFHIRILGNIQGTVYMIRQKHFTDFRSPFVSKLARMSNL